MDPSQQKERFSEAYLHAVAAVAGCGLAKPVPDDQSVDWTVHSPIEGTHCRSPRLDVQLKCTSSIKPGSTPCSFAIKSKNYNDLREAKLVVPRILVVVAVPKNLSDWIRHTRDELLLRRCAYWCTLRGLPPQARKTKVGVQVDRSQLFGPDALKQIMRRIADGANP
jgi:hypothetical protein